MLWSISILMSNLNYDSGRNLLNIFIILVSKNDGKWRGGYENLKVILYTLESAM